jgi:5-formyltetrahydrofolate cyclo-ligase
MGVKEDKIQLRRDVLVRRRALSRSDVAEKSRVISEKLIMLEAFRRAHSVMLYVAIKNEVDPSYVIEVCRALGKQVLLPRTIREPRAILPVVLEPGDTMEPGEYGIPEPPKTARVVPVRSLDLVLVPGVAYSLSLARLGYGGGYYDRLLKDREYRAHSVGLAFEVQIVDSIPLGHFDRKVDAVVTEDRILTGDGRN